MGTVYKLLVAAHLICVVGGFGGLGYNALYLSLAQRRRGGGTAAVLEVNRMVSGLAEVLLYGVALFGIGAVAASHHLVKFSDAWISAALGLFVVAVGLLHGWIRPNQRRYSAVVGRLEAPAVEGGDRTSDLAALSSYEKRVGLGWGVFNVVFIAALMVMVFQPN
jgi:uncharacterized membrane protein